MSLNRQVRAQLATAVRLKLAGDSALLPGLIDGRTLDAFADTPFAELCARRDELLANPVDIPQWLGPDSRRVLRRDPELVLERSLALRGYADAWRPVVEVVRNPPPEIGSLIKLTRRLFGEIEDMRGSPSFNIDDEWDDIPRSVRHWLHEDNRPPSGSMTLGPYRNERDKRRLALEAELGSLWNALAQSVATVPQAIADGASSLHSWNSIRPGLRDRLVDIYRGAYDTGLPQALTVVRGVIEAVPQIYSGSAGKFIEALASTAFRGLGSTVQLRNSGFVDQLVPLALECIAHQDNNWAYREAIREREAAARIATDEHEFLGAARRLHASLKGRAKPLASVVDDLLSYREAHGIDDPRNVIGVPLVELSSERVAEIADVFGVSAGEMSSGLNRAIRFSQGRSAA